MVPLLAFSRFQTDLLTVCIRQSFRPQADNPADFETPGSHFRRVGWPSDKDSRWSKYELQTGFFIYFEFYLWCGIANNRPTEQGDVATLTRMDP